MRHLAHRVKHGVLRRDEWRIDHQGVGERTSATGGDHYVARERSCGAGDWGQGRETTEGGVNIFNNSWNSNLR